MIRILNAEPLGYSPEARTILTQVGEVIDGPLTRDELLREVKDIDVLIVRLSHMVDREVFDTAGHLRAVVTAATGLDHVDLDYASARGVRVLSLRGETAFLRDVSATAEHTWALLLALVRRIPAAANSVRAGTWNRDAFRGRELSGKRLGLVGFGRLGRKVALYGLCFGTRVAAYDPQPSEPVDGVEYTKTLYELLASSDLVSLHAPLTTETQGMLGAAELATLPPRAMLINTSRGELVDEAALIHALASGHLAGAALDVICGERSPDRERSELLAYARTHDDLLLTPHIGGATEESMKRTELFMAKQLADFLAGRE